MNMFINKQNPFQKACKFTFETDCKNFSLKKQSETIKPKTKITIEVNYVSDSTSNQRDITGKLQVTSETNQQWTYYVRSLPRN